MKIISMLRPLCVSFTVLTLLTGLAYPGFVTWIGRQAFPAEAAGSLIVAGGEVRGSALIGQSFKEPQYFWGRLSATAPMPYNALATGGSNFGPANPALTDAVRERIAALRAADPALHGPVPVDLVTASGSGLDPHITPAAALYQVGRVAAARGMDPVALRQLVFDSVERPQWRVLGEARVNVLLLNLRLDNAQ